MNIEVPLAPRAEHNIEAIVSLGWQERCEDLNCAKRKTMPMTEKDCPEERESADGKASLLLSDEQLAAMASAYLDNELEGKERQEFEALMQKTPALAREIAEMQRLESQLGEMGKDILSEPIPDSMLDSLARLRRE